MSLAAARGNALYRSMLLTLCAVLLAGCVTQPVPRTDPPEPKITWPDASRLAAGEYLAYGELRTISEAGLAALPEATRTALTTSQTVPQATFLELERSTQTQVLARPRVAVRAGEPAHFELAAPGQPPHMAMDTAIEPLDGGMLRLNLNLMVAEAGQAPAVIEESRLVQPAIGEYLCYGPLTMHDGRRLFFLLALAVGE